MRYSAGGGTEDRVGGQEEGVKGRGSRRTSIAVAVPIQAAMPVMIQFDVVFGRPSRDGADAVSNIPRWWDVLRH